MAKVYVPDEVMNRMIDDGFTKKMVYHYFHYINAEKEENFEPGYMKWAHEHGFIAQHAIALGVNEDNYKEFISDYDYYKSWPHNSWLRMWINDKLTQKYLLVGTKWEYLFPKYYYYSVPNCGIRVLVDNPYPEMNPKDGLIRLLKEKNAIACKPNNGTESVGFHKLSYKNDNYYINSELVDESAIRCFMDEHPNYIFTEYIVSGHGLEKIHEKIHTLRVTVINDGGGYKNPKIIGGYLRFPVDGLGEANFQSDDCMTVDSYALYAAVEMNTGIYTNFIAAYPNHVEYIKKHPDTGLDLSKEFRIDIWDEVVRVSKELSCYLFGTELLGFDFGITNKGLRLMEINGLPGNRGNQLSRDVFDNSDYVDYVRKKVKEIDDLPLEERRKRQSIV